MPEINGVLVLLARGDGLAWCRPCAAARGRGLVTGGAARPWPRGRRQPRTAPPHLRVGYRENGYRYLDRYSYVTPDGQRPHVRDPCRFLVKPLDADVLPPV